VKICGYGKNIHWGISLRYRRVRDRKTQRCKGYAFLEMASLDDATNVMQALNGKLMRKRELTVNIVEEKAAIHRPTAQMPPERSYQKVERKSDTLKMKRPRKITLS
jgi:RNA recognition motif-containing protein